MTFLSFFITYIFPQNINYKTEKNYPKKVEVYIVHKYYASVKAEESLPHYMIIIDSKSMTNSSLGQSNAC